VGFLPALAIFVDYSTRFAVVVSVTPVTIQELNEHTHGKLRQAAGFS